MNIMFQRLQNSAVSQPTTPHPKSPHREDLETCENVYAPELWKLLL